ncbi:ABC transporter substrate-binding protein [Arthrobacter luteolus]|uniref:ABC transporter substrate-binding protein n=1 Tax=Arthrobacter luteolus TaxID=98672 RepID=UPI00083081E2|nr:ABC transporter substrate-binding protein [Arthrobacter luteolus]
MIRRGTVRRYFTIAALSAAALGLAACGSPGEAAAEEAVQIGYFPLVHTATAVNAEENGLFAAEGLEVELVQTQGGAAAIPALISGNVDLTYANYTSALLAVQQGLPVRFISGNDVGAADHGIYVAKDSGITTVEDLAGKTFAVNNLQNIGTVAIYSLLEDAGLDTAAVDLIEMPYPDMQAALERGAVDAIWQVEPFQASAEAAGFVKISNLFTGPVEGMPVAGWITTEKFLQENPEAVEGFRKAIAASAEELQDNRARLAELVPTFTKVSAEVVEQIEMPRFQGQLDGDQLQKTADLMHKYKIIDAALDVRPLLAD